MGLGRLYGKGLDEWKRRQNKEPTSQELNQMIERLSSSGSYINLQRSQVFDQNLVSLERDRVEHPY